MNKLVAALYFAGASTLGIMALDAGLRVHENLLEYNKLRYTQGESKRQASDDALRDLIAGIATGTGALYTVSFGLKKILKDETK